jgi:hypothetical protein
MNKLIEERKREMFLKLVSLISNAEGMVDLANAEKYFQTSLNEVVEEVSKQKDLEISRLKHQDDELTKADCYANGYKAGVEAREKEILDIIERESDDIQKFEYDGTNGELIVRLRAELLSIQNKIKDKSIISRSTLDK